MKIFQAGDKVIFAKTNVINDKKLVGKKAVVEFQCVDGMVWIKIGRSSRCVHPDYLA